MHVYVYALLITHQVLESIPWSVWVLIQVDAQQVL